MPSLGYSPPIYSLPSISTIPLLSRHHHLSCGLPQSPPNWSPCMHFHGSTVAQVILKQVPFHILKSTLTQPLHASLLLAHPSRPVRLVSFCFMHMPAHSRLWVLCLMLPQPLLPSLTSQQSWPFKKSFCSLLNYHLF